MKGDTRKDEAQARATEAATAESEQITGTFAFDLGLLDKVVVDDVLGQTTDALGSVKRRIRKTVERAGRSGR